VRVMGVRLDRHVLIVAGAVVFAFALVSQVAFEVADNAIDFGTDSNWPFAFYALFLVGVVAGGWLAGRARPEAPLAHGSLAALGALIAIAVVTVVIDAALGHGILNNLVKLVAQFPAIVGVAALTAYFVARRAIR
jgi:hypothetical protein